MIKHFPYFRQQTEANSFVVEPSGCERGFGEFAQKTTHFEGVEKLHISGKTRVNQPTWRLWWKCESGNCDELVLCSNVKYPKGRHPKTTLNL